MVQMDIPATNGVIQVVENVIDIKDDQDRKVLKEIEEKYKNRAEPRIFKFR